MSDRFRGPSPSDEIARCAKCDGQFHYLQLDDDFLCQECAPEPEPPPKTIAKPDNQA